MNKRSILFSILITIIVVSLIIVIIRYNNAQKPYVVGDGSMIIACVGDSITNGYGVNNRKDTWVSLLATKLDVTTINYGLNGRTLLSSGDEPYMDEEMADIFWKSQEDKVVFMLGTNDTKNNNWDKDKFYDEYKNIVKELIKKDGKENVFIVAPPRVFMNMDGMPNNDYLLEEISMIKDIGNKLDVTVIDLYELTDGHDEWYFDGLHLNEQGNIEVANEIAKYLK